MESSYNDGMINLFKCKVQATLHREIFTELYFRVLNFSAFNFRHPSDRRKFFNGENFPIYGMLLYSPFFPNDCIWCAPAASMPLTREMAAGLPFLDVLHFGRQIQRPGTSCTVPWTLHVLPYPWQVSALWCPAHQTQVTWLSHDFNTTSHDLHFWWLWTDLEAHFQIC